MVAAALWRSKVSRSVLVGGHEERTSPLMNDSLGVGDYTQSNNARPLPQVRAGFVDFQNIPFTNDGCRYRAR